MKGMSCMLQRIEKILPPVALPEHLPGDTGLDSAVLIDIETTGLSPERSFVYLIGQIRFLENGERQLRQYFAENAAQEAELLRAFFQSLKKSDVLIQYNGDRFDLPFLAKRAAKLDVPCPLEHIPSLDLYKIIHPLKNVLGLIDGRQQTVESLLGTGRIEARSGKELIAAYADFTESGSETARQLILSHNEADIRGLSGLLCLSAYEPLFHTEQGIPLYRAKAEPYLSYDGTPRNELLLYFHPREPYPAPILGTAHGCMLRVQGNEGIIKIPIYTGELKYYYADYREYWYFPEEDEALHRSVAVYADRSHRIPATADTCYTRKTGDFLPEWSEFQNPVFKKERRDPTAWFEFTKELRQNRSFFEAYAGYIVRHILSQK